MARFDVHRHGDSGTLWLNCQADRLDHLSHRFVVPLVEPDQAPTPAITGLNPVLTVADAPYVMLTQFSASIPVGELGRRIAKLADDDHRIVQALDTLIGTA